MRTFLAAVVLFCGALACYAETIETTDGRKYENATISRAEPDGLVIMHSAGIVKIPFQELKSEQLRQKYPFDPVAAKQHAESISAANAAAAAQVSQAKAAENAQSAKEISELEQRQRIAGARKAIAGFTMEAYESGTTHAENEVWHTDYGSSDVHFQQNKKILVKVHDVSGNTAPCTVSVYFVARSLTRNVHMVYAKEVRNLRVDRGMVAETAIPSPTITSQILTLAALKEVWAKGAQMEGWIAVAEIGDQRFGFKPSNGAVSGDSATLIRAYEEKAKEVEGQ